MCLARLPFQACFKVQLPSTRTSAHGTDVSGVNSMSSTFQGASSFNQNLGSWNVANVNNMNNMFMLAVAFSQEFCWDLMDGVPPPHPDIHAGPTNAVYSGSACQCADGQRILWRVRASRILSAHHLPLLRAHTFPKSQCFCRFTVIHQFI